MSTAQIILSAADKTKAAFNSVQDNLGKLTSRLTSTQAKMFGLVGAGGFGAFLKMSVSAKLETKAFADTLRTSNQDMLAWEYGLKGAGIETGKLADIWRDSSEKIGEAASSGTGEAAEILQKLNLNAQEMVKLSPGQKLLEVGEALKAVKSQDERIYMMESLASDSSQLLPYITDNAEQFGKMRDQAVATGAAISDIDAEKLQAANASLSRSASIMSGVGARIVAQLSPYISAASKWFADLAQRHGGFRDLIISGVKTVVEGVAWMADAWNGLKVVWKLLELGFAKFANFVWQKWQSTVGEIFEQAAELPLIGENFQTAADIISGSADMAAYRVEQLDQELTKMLLEPPPGDKVRAAMKDIGKAAQEEAEKVRLAKADIGSSVTDVGGYVDPKAAEQQQKERDRLSQQYESLRTSLTNENQLYVEKFNEREFLIEDAFQNGVISLNQRNETILALYQETENKKAEIMKRSNQVLYSTTLSAFQALGAKHKAFALIALGMEKAQAIASLAVEQEKAAGAAFAYASPAGPAAAAAAEAAVRARYGASMALVGATGIVQAAGIAGKSESQGGSSFPSNDVGGQPVQQQQAPQEIRLVVKGEGMDDSELGRAFMKMIQSADLDFVR